MTQQKVTYLTHANNYLPKVKKLAGLNDNQFNLLKQHLTWFFGKETIELYLSSKNDLKKSETRAKQIFKEAERFIENNKILLNCDVKD